MYNYIKGEVTGKENGTLTVEAYGIGYSINASHSCYDKNHIGDEIKIYTFLNIKEDSHTLFGFSDNTEKHLFLQLLSVSGVGAKSALNILSIGSERLASEISKGNANTIASVKGIGRKTAEKIILDLRDKVFKTDTEFTTTPQTSEIQDALLGLIALGLTKYNAQEAIKSINTENMSAEQIILTALKKRS